MTVEMEADTRALRWISSRSDCQTAHAIFLTDSVSLLQALKTRWNGKSRLNSPVDLLPEVAYILEGLNFCEASRDAADIEDITASCVTMSSVDCMQN